MFIFKIYYFWLINIFIFGFIIYIQFKMIQNTTQKQHTQSQSIQISATLKINNNFTSQKNVQQINTQVNTINNKKSTNINPQLKFQIIESPQKNAKQSKSFVQKTIRSKTQVNQQQNQHHDYKNLTFKLESALKKISSTSNPMKNSSIITSSMTHRFNEFEQKKKKQINQKKKQIEKQLYSQIKQKPTIDKKSEQISRQLNNEPIYKRFYKICENKKKKNIENEELKKRRQQQQIQNFIQQYNKHLKIPQNRRTYEKYYEQMVRWKNKQIQKSAEELQKKKSQQLQGLTFTPLLCQKSRKLIQSHTQIPIYERGLKKPKIKQNIKKNK